MDTVTLAVFLAWLGGGFVAGVTTMGAALFAVPITAFFLPMQDTVLLSCLSLPFMQIVMVSMNLRSCRPAAILPLLAGTVPGSLAGLWILELLPDRTLRICVGAILVLFPVWHLAARVQPHGENGKAAALAGFLSGVLGTSTSFDGPPAAAYGLYAGWQPRIMLGTLGLYYLTRSVFQCCLQGFAGLYTESVLHYALWSAPAAMLGIVLAYPLAKRLSVVMMKRLLLTVIGLGGISCLLKALFW